MSVSSQRFVAGLASVRLSRWVGCVVVLAVGLFHESPKVNARVVQETRFALGTSVTVMYIDKNKKPEIVLEAAFSEIRRLERLLSTYRNDSQVTYLNRNGSITGELCDLKEVLRQSLRFSLLSNGAFDVTVKPLIDLYRTSDLKTRKRPTNEEIMNAIELVGHRGIMIDEHKIAFEKPGMGVNLDGIAKGYIIDRAIEVLLHNGITRAYVNAGGDIRVIGQRDHNDPWRVALQHPRHEDDFIAIVYLNDQAIATSGDYTLYFFSDRRLHHIVDPRTGLPTSGLISATVVTDRAMHADALATSVFVLGPVQGAELIEGLPKTEALMITDTREMLLSSGFEKFASISQCVNVADRSK